MLWTGRSDARERVLSSAFDSVSVSTKLLVTLGLLRLGQARLTGWTLMSIDPLRRGGWDLEVDLSAVRVVVLAIEVLAHRRLGAIAARGCRLRPCSR